jgi:hypothetical protein
VVRDDYRRVELNCLVGDGFGEINGKEDVVGLSARGDEGCLEEESSVIPGVVCKGWWIAG